MNTVPSSSGKLTYFFVALTRQYYYMIGFHLPNKYINGKTGATFYEHVVTASWQYLNNAAKYLVGLYGF